VIAIRRELRRTRLLRPAPLSPKGDHQWSSRGVRATASPQDAPAYLLVNEPGAPERWILSVKVITIPTPSRRAVA
jgi:hypothetical protein